jgi:hypothetical protein
MSYRRAILSVALFLVSTIAQAQQSNQQDPCFELYRNPSPGIAGALLLNKCTGQTWILIASTSPARWQSHFRNH